MDLKNTQKTTTYEYIDEQGKTIILKGIPLYQDINDDNEEYYNLAGLLKAEEDYQKQQNQD